MPEEYSKPSSTGIVNEIAEKYHVDSENSFTMVEKAQNGISVTAFFDLVAVSNLTKEELSGLLDLSYKTIQRYEKEGKKLNALNSEQLLKMIGLYQKAEEVFGSVELFNRWLRKPAAGLGGNHPFALMRTPGGIDLIREELIRIEFGSLA